MVLVVCPMAVSFKIVIAQVHRVRSNVVFIMMIVASGVIAAAQSKGETRHLLQSLLNPSGPAAGMPTHRLTPCLPSRAAIEHTNSTGCPLTGQLVSASARTMLADAKGRDWLVTWSPQLCSNPRKRLRAPGH